MSNIPEFKGNLRSHIIEVPKIIQECNGIRIFGRLIKSLIFTTDVAIIRNCNADAVIAVYPFTPQPIISHSLIQSADIPIFCGVGGGTTRGIRVVGLGVYAEQQGALGVVVNAPTKNETIKNLVDRLEIPVIVTVATEHDDIEARIHAGAKILNVSGAGKTPEIVRAIRQKYPDIGIIATGGPTDESIRETIEAGANAITYTPPTTAELFKTMMKKYRNE